MHTGNQKYGVSLAKEFQHHLTKEHHRNFVFDQGKNNREFIKNGQTDIIMFRLLLMLHTKMRKCIVKKRFPALPFCGSHSKPHGERGWGNNYHLRFYPKLGGGVCAIRGTPYACVACTSMLDKPWISLILSDKKERYKPVTNCTYWPLLGSFKN